MKHPSEQRLVISLMPLSEPERFSSMREQDGLFISVPCERDDAFSTMEAARGLRYLDRYILVLPENQAQEKQLWEKFFHVFGESYEQLIDIPHNISSIQSMLSYIGEAVTLKPESRILDYGCGSGLAIYTDCPAKLIGYEPSAVMRAQALQKGYHVLGRQEFLRVTDNYFDAGFANYVLHMAIDEAAVHEIARRLKSGAVFLANYYKGINAEKVNGYFIRCGFTPQLISDGGGDQNQCCYRYWKG